MEINEGGSAGKSIATSDVPADTVSVSASLGTITENGDGSWTWRYDGTDDLPTTEVTITAGDEDGGLSTATFALAVNNVAPVITSLVGSAALVCDTAEGDYVTVSGSFTDVGTLDTHTATVDWGDGTITAALIDQSSGSRIFIATHAYVFGGIYEIALSLSDDDTGSTTGSTKALITGAGINDGVLQIVGTAGKDQVSVKPKTKHGHGHGKKHGHGHEELIEVKANFISDKGHTRMFDASDFDSIVVVLCDGKDKAKIDKRIDKPVLDPWRGGQRRPEGRQRRPHWWRWQRPSACWQGQ